VLGFLSRRLASSLVIFLLVLSTTFLLIHLVPGDPTLVFQDSRLSPEQRENLRRLYGLDRPLAEQYLRWLSAVTLHQDFGISLSQRRPVTSVVAEAVGPTLLLASAATAVELAFGLALGVAAARRYRRPFDAVARLFSLVLYSQPVFWLGLMLVLFFSTVWPVLPTSHMHSIDADAMSLPGRWLDLLLHLALPALALGLPASGATARFVRASFLEVMERPFILAARARGLSEARLVWVHGLRNAAIPLVQLLAISFPALLSGSLAVEVIFSWPGMGRLTFESILARDYPVILATTALSALFVLVGNFLSDLAHAALDPRVRKG
jgi:peptide/nickel transport system permease protein